MPSLDTASYREKGRPRGPAHSPGHFPAFSILLGAAALLPAFFPALTGLLQFDRGAIASGEAWRIITGHWTHWGWEHLAWDVAVFVFLGALCERRSRWLFLRSIVAGSLVVSLAVWTALPHVHYYRGLSGLDAALYVITALMIAGDRKTNRSAEGVMYTVLLLSAFCAKIGYEAASGSAFFVSDMGSAAPVPAAHLAGAAAGALSFMATGTFRRSARTGIPLSLWG